MNHRNPVTGDGGNTHRMYSEVHKIIRAEKRGTYAMARWVGLSFIKIFFMIFV